MKNGFSRLYKPVTAIALAAGALTACYQSVWEATFQSDIESGRNYTLTSTVDNAGNLLVGGSSTIATSTDEQGRVVRTQIPVLLKYDANGQLLWTFQHDSAVRNPHFDPAIDYTEGFPAAFGPELHYAETQQIVVDAQNNTYAIAIVPGENFVSDSGDSDVAVFKLDQNGNVIWNVIAGKAGHQSAINAGLSSAGELLLITQDYETNTIVAGAIDDATGATLWERATPYFTSGDIKRSVAISPQGVAVPVRSSVSSGDIHFVVYDAEGETLLTYHQPYPSSWWPTCGGFVPDCHDHTLQSLSFIGEDILIAERNESSDDEPLTDLIITRLDLTGTILWQTTVADPDISAEANAFYELEELGQWFKSFSAPTTFYDTHVAVKDDRIYIGLTGFTQYITPAYFDDYAWAAFLPYTQSKLVALDTSGNLLWQSELGGSITTSNYQDESDNRQSRATTTWQVMSDLEIAPNGQAVVGLNSLVFEDSPLFWWECDSPCYTVSLNKELKSRSGKLITFDNTTGKSSTLSKLSDQVVRSVSILPDGKKIRVGDSDGYRMQGTRIFNYGLYFESQPSTVDIRAYR